jgi:dTDP-glucose 4,6-dehydratase
VRVLITGGAGFLGSHLCDRFLAEGHHVIAMDNLLTGTTRNIEHLAGHERFRFIKHDVTNYIYIEGALGIAKEKGARFLLASTSEVYGDPLEHPQTESYWGNVNPIGLRGCYDEAKRFGEAITMAYHREHGVDTRIVRIFNTYGPRMRLDDGRVIPNFVGQALRGERSMLGIHTQN